MVKLRVEIVTNRQIIMRNNLLKGLKLVPFLLLFFGINEGITQQAKIFKVIKTTGNISSLTTNEVLKTRSTFLEKDVIIFSSKNDWLVVIDNQQRAYLLRPHESLKGFHSKSIRAKFNTRPGKILTYFQFNKYLEGRNFLILGDSLAIEVISKELPMDEHSFFYISYKWKDEVINKRLTHNNNSLLIKKETLHRVDGKIIQDDDVTNYKLHHYFQDKDTSLLINDFVPIFPNQKILVQEIQTIIDAMPTAKPDEQVDTIENYLFQVYGVPEQQNLKDWLYVNFQL